MQPRHTRRAADTRRLRSGSPHRSAPARGTDICQAAHRTLRHYIRQYSGTHRLRTPLAAARNLLKKRSASAAPRQSRPPKEESAAEPTLPFFAHAPQPWASRLASQPRRLCASLCASHPAAPHARAARHLTHRKHLRGTGARRKKHSLRVTRSCGTADASLGAGTSHRSMIQYQICGRWGGGRTPDRTATWDAEAPWSRRQTACRAPSHTAHPHCAAQLRWRAS